MSDIVERAQAVLEHPDTRIGHGLVGALVDEVKRLRREVRYLNLTITEEVGHLSEDESAELDNLSGEFL
jgi:hypothetical protein